MSGFMNYLNDIDNNLINEDDTEEVVDVVEDDGVVLEKVETPTPTRRTKSKKDVSVKLLESRIRLKLDDMGFGDKLIEEVVSDVFNGVSKVKDVNNASQTQAPKTAPVQESSIMGRAESILGGLPEDGSYSPMMSESGFPTQNTKLSNIADHASSLL